MDELNFDTLMDAETTDISSLNIQPEKLDILQTLGVSTVPTYKPKADDENKPKANVDESEATDENIKNEENRVIDVKIETNVDEPNIILQRSELVRALRYANVMIKKVTNDIEASSLNITFKDDGKVLYRLKDNMTWVTLEGTCGVSNNNPITKTLSFRFPYLVKLLSATAEDILIYEGKSVDQKGEEVQVYYIRLINGDYILDVFEGNEAKLVPAGNKSNAICTISGKELNTLCSTMLPLVSETQEVQSKRSILYEDRAIFKSATYLLQFKGKFNNMCLSKKELDLLNIVSPGDVTIYSTDSNGENRLVFESGSVSISTSVSVPQRDQVLISRLSVLEEAKYVKVNKEDFKRVLFLSGLGTNNVGRLYMNYNVDNKGIDAKIEGRTGNSTLVISGENYNNLEPKSEPFTIYAPQLSILLKAFESGNDLEVAFLDEGVAFRDKNLGIDAIMNYAH